MVQFRWAVPELIRHLGVSNVSAEQVAAAQSIAPVVAVQNFYNLAVRAYDALVDQCAEQGIAFVPFFPRGGFRPLQSGVLDKVAAGLLENAGAAGVELPAEAV